jgi:hypothetical protein
MSRPATKGLSAQNFQEPLLLALLELGDGKLKMVDASDTYIPVMAKMGITMDEYGKQEESGSPWVKLWIGWAFRQLKDENLTRSLKKGHWGLTDEGLKRARLISVQGKKMDTTNTPTNQDTATSPEVFALSMTIGPGNKDPGEYHPDPYIRSLAIQGTACFGTYSTKAICCATCSLSGACANMLASELSRLAGVLDREDTAPAEATPVPGPPVEDSDTYESMIVHIESVCAKCGGVMVVGDRAYWSHKAGKSGGMYHPACAGKP